MPRTNVGRKMHTQDCLHKSTISAQVDGGNRGKKKRGGGIIGLRCVRLAVPLALRVTEFREKPIIALP